MQVQREERVEYDLLTNLKNLLFLQGMYLRTFVDKFNLNLDFVYRGNSVTTNFSQQQISEGETWTGMVGDVSNHVKNHIATISDQRRVWQFFF